MTTPSLPHLPGQPFFSYREGALYCEDTPVAALAQAHETPLFVYSQAAMLHALDDYRRGFVGRKVKIHYAVKANSNLAVLQFFAQQGCGFDIVSSGEMQRALAAGARPEDIVFSGVGKTRQEMREALTVGIGCFNVESIAELHILSSVAHALGKQAPVSLRVNPNVDAKTHPYISTGLKDNKFGISHEQALATFQLAASLPGLKVIGIDCHIGSQITTESPFLDALDKVLDLVEQVEAAGIPLAHIDCGGGLGIDYQNETLPDTAELWKKMFAKADARGYADRTFMIEPGRSLVGNSAICVTQVLYLKPGEEKNFCIVDAAMNDLPRPAMYEAYHAIVPVLQNTGAAPATYDVVGPVCESGDWLGRDRTLAVAQDEWLAVCSAGAYCMSMASNYNSRPKAAEVLVDGQQVDVIRERDTFAQMTAGERMRG